MHNRKCKLGLKNGHLTQKIDSSLNIDDFSFVVNMLLRLKIEPFFPSFSSPWKKDLSLFFLSLFSGLFKEWFFVVLFPEAVSTHLLFYNFFDSSSIWSLCMSRCRLSSRSRACSPRPLVSWGINFTKHLHAIFSNICLLLLFKDKMLHYTIFTKETLIKRHFVKLVVWKCKAKFIYYRDLKNVCL